MAAFPVLSVQGTTCVKHANQWRFIVFNALAPLFVVNTWRCFMLAAEAFNWTGVLVLLASNKNGYWISNKTRLSCLEWERPIIPRHGIVTNGGMTYVFDRNDIITNWIERSPPMHLFRCARVAHFTHFRFLPWSDNTNHNCIYRMRATAALSFMRITENNAPSLHVTSCMQGNVSVIAAAWLRMTQQIPHRIYTIRWHSSHRSSQSAKQLVTSFACIAWLAAAIYTDLSLVRAWSSRDRPRRSGWTFPGTATKTKMSQSSIL